VKSFVRRLNQEPVDKIKHNLVFSPDSKTPDIGFTEEVVVSCQDYTNDFFAVTLRYVEQFLPSDSRGYDVFYIYLLRVLKYSYPETIVLMSYESVVTRLEKQISALNVKDADDEQKSNVREEKKAERNIYFTMLKSTALVAKQTTSSFYH
jgi:hypothetical protein